MKTETIHILYGIHSCYDRYTCICHPVSWDSFCFCGYFHLWQDGIPMVWNFPHSNMLTMLISRAILWNSSIPWKPSVDQTVSLRLELFPVITFSYLITTWMVLILPDSGLFFVFFLWLICHCINFFNLIWIFYLLLIGFSTCYYCCYISFGCTYKAPWFFILSARPSSR